MLWQNCSPSSPTFSTSLEEEKWQHDTITTCCNAQYEISCRALKLSTPCPIERGWTRSISANHGCKLLFRNRLGKCLKKKSTILDTAHHLFIIKSSSVSSSIKKSIYYYFLSVILFILADSNRNITPTSSSPSVGPLNNFVNTYSHNDYIDSIHHQNPPNTQRFNQTSSSSQHLHFNDEGRYFYPPTNHTTMAPNLPPTTTTSNLITTIPIGATASAAPPSSFIKQQTSISQVFNNSQPINGQQQQHELMSCSNGFLTFELSTGFIYKPTSAETLAMLPSTLQLTDCLDFCLHNSSCLAINFEMGLCVLLSSSAKQNPLNLYSSQFPVFTIYAEKKCLLAGDPQAGKQARRCQRAWTFERVAGYEMKTRPRRRLKFATKEHCMEACLLEQEFECRSANWYRQTGECTLSDQDRHSVSHAEAGDQHIIKSSLHQLYGPSNHTSAAPVPMQQQQQQRPVASRPNSSPPPPPTAAPSALYSSPSLADHQRQLASNQQQQRHHHLIDPEQQRLMTLMLTNSSTSAASSLPSMNEIDSSLLTMSAATRSGRANQLLDSAAAGADANNNRNKTTRYRNIRQIISELAKLRDNATALLRSQQKTTSSPSRSSSASSTATTAANLATYNNEVDDDSFTLSKPASSNGSANQQHQSSTSRQYQQQQDWPPMQYMEIPGNFMVDYLENNCVYEPNKLCEFRKIQNRVLKTVDSIYQEVASLEECKQKCLNAPYRCYSFDYGDTSERVCRTSHLDQASLLSVKDPYLDVVGAITYELASCFNVTIQCRAREMVALVSSSKTFRGRIYVRSRPSSCVNDVKEALQFELSMRYHDPKCDVRSSSSQHQGVFSNDIVIQHHDRIVTTQDVGLSVYCQYDLGNRSITNNVDLAIERLDTTAMANNNNNEQQMLLESKNQQLGGGGTMQHNSPLTITSLATTVVRSPNVTMRITNMNGQPVTSATVGDRLALLFEIKEKSSPFGILVREIIAMDGRQVEAEAATSPTNNHQISTNNNNNKGYHYGNGAAQNYSSSTSSTVFPPAAAPPDSSSNSIQFIDSNGCPTDANLMGPLVKMDPSGHRILAPFDAFKFPTSDMVFFRAVVTSCIAECKPTVCVASSSSLNDYSSSFTDPFGATTVAAAAGAAPTTSSTTVMTTTTTTSTTTTSSSIRLPPPTTAHSNRHSSATSQLMSTQAAGASGPIAARLSTTLAPMRHNDSTTSPLDDRLMSTTTTSSMMLGSLLDDRNEQATSSVSSGNRAQLAATTLNELLLQTTPPAPLMNHSPSSLPMINKNRQKPQAASDSLTTVAGYPSSSSSLAATTSISGATTTTGGYDGDWQQHKPISSQATQQQVLPPHSGISAASSALNLGLPLSSNSPSEQDTTTTTSNKLLDSNADDVQLFTLDHQQAKSAMAAKNINNITEEPNGSFSNLLSTPIVSTASTLIEPHVHSAALTSGQNGVGQQLTPLQRHQLGLLIELSNNKLKQNSSSSSPGFAQIQMMSKQSALEEALSLWNNKLEQQDRLTLAHLAELALAQGLKQPSMAQAVLGMLNEQQKELLACLARATLYSNELSSHSHLSPATQPSAAATAAALAPSFVDDNNNNKLTDALSVLFGTIVATTTNSDGAGAMGNLTHQQHMQDSDKVAYWINFILEADDRQQQQAAAAGRGNNSIKQWEVSAGSTSNNKPLPPNDNNDVVYDELASASNLSQLKLHQLQPQAAQNINTSEGFSYLSSPTSPSLSVVSSEQPNQSSVNLFSDYIHRLVLESSRAHEINTTNTTNSIYNQQDAIRLIPTSAGSGARHSQLPLSASASSAVDATQDNDLVMSASSTSSSGGHVQQLYTSSVLAANGISTTTTTTPTSLSTTKKQQQNISNSNKKVQQQQQIAVAQASSNNNNNNIKSKTRSQQQSPHSTSTATTTTSTTTKPNFISQLPPSQRQVQQQQQQQQHQLATAKKKRDKQQFADFYMGALPWAATSGQNTSSRLRKKRSSSSSSLTTQKLKPSNNYVIFSESQQTPMAPSVVRLSKLPSSSKARFTRSLVQMYHMEAGSQNNEKELDLALPFAPSRYKRDVAIPSSKQPFYDLDSEMIVQSIKIVDRLQFEDELEQNGDQQKRSSKVNKNKVNHRKRARKDENDMIAGAEHVNANRKKLVQSRNKMRSQQDGNATFGLTQSLDEDGQEPVGSATNSLMLGTDAESEEEINEQQSQRRFIVEWSSPAVLGLIIVATCLVLMQVSLVALCLLDSRRAAERRKIHQELQRRQQLALAAAASSASVRRILL